MGEANRRRKMLKEFQYFAETGMLVDFGASRHEGTQNLNLSYVDHPKAPFDLKELRAGRTVFTSFKRDRIELPGNTLAISAYNLLTADYDEKLSLSLFREMPWTDADVDRKDREWFEANPECDFYFREAEEKEAELAELVSGWKPNIIVIQLDRKRDVRARFSYPVKIGVENFVPLDSESAVLSILKMTDFDCNNYDGNSLPFDIDLYG